MRSIGLYIDKTIGQPTKARTARRLKKWADELRKLATANIALHLVLNKKSELNFNDEDGVWDSWKYGPEDNHQRFRVKKCGVIKLFVDDFFSNSTHWQSDRDQGHFNKFVTKWSSQVNACCRQILPEQLILV